MTRRRSYRLMFIELPYFNFNITSHIRTHKNFSLKEIGVIYNIILTCEIDRELAD